MRLTWEIIPCLFREGGGKSRRAISAIPAVTTSEAVARRRFSSNPLCFEPSTRNPPSMRYVVQVRGGAGYYYHEIAGSSVTPVRGLRAGRRATHREATKRGRPKAPPIETPSRPFGLRLEQALQLS